MVGLIIGVVLGIIAFVLLGSRGFAGLFDKDTPLLKFGGRSLVTLLIIGGFVLLSSITSIPTGNTGVVVTFGHVEDYTLDAGIHFIAPWRDVIKMDNRTQLATVELSCFSSDIQEVSVIYAVNYQISKENAQTIYRTIGLDYLNTVMQPKIQEAVKGVTAKYTAEKIVGMRGTLSTEIEEVLKESLAKYNIELISTSMNNIDFTDAFTNAVEAKQVAEQNKLKAQTEQAQANLEAQAAAERQVIKAQADADASILAAEADAKVQQIGADAAEYAGKKEAAILSNIGEQMTKYPGLEKYYYYQNWDGKLPVTMLGGNTEVLMEMPSVDVTDNITPTVTPTNHNDDSVG